MSYALDRLGFLQFEQLVAALLELEGGIGVDAWLVRRIAADRY